MKIRVPYQEGAKGKLRGVEELLEQELQEIRSCPRGGLLHILFYVDEPIKVIVASMEVLSCIAKRFPDYRPKAILSNTVPAAKLAIEIEFGSFRDIGKGFV